MERREGVCVMDHDIGMMNVRGEILKEMKDKRVDIGLVFCHKCFKDLDKGDKDIWIYNKLWIICKDCKEDLDNETL